MSSTSIASRTFKPASTSPLRSLMLEIFRATPLYIAATAVASIVNGKQTPTAR